MVYNEQTNSTFTIPVITCCWCFGTEWKFAFLLEKSVILSSLMSLVHCYFFSVSLDLHKWEESRNEGEQS